MLATDMQVDALDFYNERKDEALADIQTVIRFAIFLMLAGTLLSLATSLVTARGIVRFERRLANGRELLRVTLESIADAVITTDRKGIITFVNRTGESMTGCPAAEASGRPLNEVLRLVEDSSRISVESTAAIALRDGSVATSPHSSILISRSKCEFPVEEHAAAIRDEDGAIVGAVLIVRDVTQRHRLESELRVQAAALMETDRRKTEFLSMLSHELRNPLAPISNALQILRRHIDHAPGLRPTVSMMERQVSLMVRLVDDLVDISRISRGKIELRIAPADLVEVLQLAVEGVRPILDSKEHDLRVTLPSQPVTIQADAARLAQIVGNLLSNAAKFTDRRGVVELGVQMVADSVVITVSDSGIGISPQHLPYVFDLYMQADSSLGRSSTGIGLGLALVKDLVALHGGSITVSSPGVGMGSTFVVRLPHHSHSPGSSTEEATTLTCPERPTHVLVVDDDKDALEPHWSAS
jgi:PAS domain S-box-containing protein